MGLGNRAFIRPILYALIDAGSTPKTLTLGYGGVIDNSGQLNIQQFAVAPKLGAAPEPGSQRLLCVGLSCSAHPSLPSNFCNVAHSGERSQLQVNGSVAHGVGSGVLEAAQLGIAAPIALHNSARVPGWCQSVGCGSVRKRDVGWSFDRFRSSRSPAMTSPEIHVAIDIGIRRHDRVGHLPCFETTR